MRIKGGHINYADQSRAEDEKTISREGGTIRSLRKTWGHRQRETRDSER